VTNAVEAAGAPAPLPEPEVIELEADASAPPAAAGDPPAAAAAAAGAAAAEVPASARPPEAAEDARQSRRSARAHKPVAILSSDEDSDASEDPQPCRRAKRSAPASAAFFLSPAERKKRAREEAASAAAAAAAQASLDAVDAAAAAERAHEASLAALRSERAATREVDARLHQGRSVHTFFSMPRGGSTVAAAATDVHALPSGPLQPPLPPVHVGAHKADAPAPAWPAGMLLAAPPAPYCASLGAPHDLSKALGLLLSAPPAPMCDSGVIDLTECEVVEERVLRSLCAHSLRAAGGEEHAELSCPSDEGHEASAACMAALRETLGELRAARAACDDPTAPGALWTARYAPRAAQQLCASGDGVAALQEWLSAWKAHIQGGAGGADQPPRPPPPARRRRHDDDWGAFIGEDEDEDECDEEAEKPLATALLLSGPPGAGKSSLAYAAAAQLGFSVIEIGANARRGGADVLQRFGEATQSKRLTQPTTHQLRAPAAHPQQRARAPQQQQPSVKRRRRAVVSSEEEEEEKAQEEGHPATGASERVDAAPAAPGAAAPEACAMSVILFDEADILCGEGADRGFAAAVSSLALSAKCPLLLTVNSPWALLAALPPALTRHARLGRPGGGAEGARACARLTLCALVEGHELTPAQAAAALAHAQGDFRSAMMQMQLSCTGGVTASSGWSWAAELADESAAFHALPPALPLRTAPPCDAALAAAAALADALRTAQEAHLGWLARQAAHREARRVAAAEAARAAKARARADAKRAREAAMAGEEDGAQGEVAAGAEQEEPPRAEQEAPAPAPDAPPPPPPPPDAMPAAAGARARRWEGGGVCERGSGDAALLECLAALSGQLSDAHALRHASRVGATGPAPWRLWAEAVAAGACAEQGAAEQPGRPDLLDCDASSPASGPDGGQPRSTLGGGEGVCSSAAQLCAAGYLRLGLHAAAAHAQHAAAPPPPPPPQQQQQTEPDGGLPFATLRCRTLLSWELDSPRAAACDRAALTLTHAYAARMARLEAQQGARALGRRHRLALRGRHVDVSDGALAQLATSSAFNCSP